MKLERQVRYRVWLFRNNLCINPLTTWTWQAVHPPNSQQDASYVQEFLGIPFNIWSIKSELCNCSQCRVKTATLYIMKHPLYYSYIGCHSPCCNAEIYLVLSWWLLGFIIPNILSVARIIYCLYITILFTGEGGGVI